MKQWVTEFEAVDAQSGKMKTWVGPLVNASTEAEAKTWCQQNAGYLKVVGEFIEEVDYKKRNWSLLTKMI